jgi:hypothetical protein
MLLSLGKEREGEVEGKDITLRNVGDGVGVIPQSLVS